MIDVADDHDREVEVLEGARHAGRDDEDAGDLDERQQAVLDVVGVVGGREPGEVHPRPPDRKKTTGSSSRRGRSRPRRDRGGGTSRPGRRPPRNTGRTGARAVSRPMRLGRVTAGHADVPRTHPRSDSDLAHQWRKCRVPVISIAPPTASTAATTSASRTDPPGWANAVTPAARQTSTASANG